MQGGDAGLLGLWRAAGLLPQHSGLAPADASRDDLARALRGNWQEQPTETLEALRALSADRPRGLVVADVAAVLKVSKRASKAGTGAREWSEIQRRCLVLLAQWVATGASAASPPDANARGVARSVHQRAQAVYTDMFREDDDDHAQACCAQQDGAGTAATLALLLSTLAAAANTHTQHGALRCLRLLPEQAHAAAWLPELVASIGTLLYMAEGGPSAADNDATAPQQLTSLLFTKWPRLPSPRGLDDERPRTKRAAAREGRGGAPPPAPRGVSAGGATGDEDEDEDEGRCALVAGALVRNAMRWYGGHIAQAAAEHGAEFNPAPWQGVVQACCTWLTRAEPYLEDEPVALWAAGGLLQATAALRSVQGRGWSPVLPTQQLEAHVAGAIRLAAQSVRDLEGEGEGKGEGEGGVTCCSTSQQKCLTTIVALACCGTVCQGQLWGAAEDLLACHLHCLLTHALALPGLRLEGAGNAIATLRAPAPIPMLTTHTDALLSSTSNLLRSLRSQSRKNVDGVRQTQRATLGYAHRVFAGYRQRLLCVPPAASADPTAIADAEAVRAVLYHGFHAITALLTESFPSVSAEEDTAADIVALGDVAEALACVNFCSVPLPAHTALLERTLQTLSDVPAAAAELAARLPSPAALTADYGNSGEEASAGEAPVWDRDLLLGSKVQLLMALLMPAVRHGKVPVATLITSVEPVVLLYLRSSQAGVASAAHALAVQMLHALQEHASEAERFARSFLQQTLAVYPTRASPEMLAAMMAVLMEAFPTSSPSKLAAVEQVAEKAAEISGGETDACQHLLNLLTLVLPVVDYPLLQRTLAIIENTVLQCAPESQHKTMDRLQDVISKCDDYARKLYLVDWYLQLRGRVDPSRKSTRPGITAKL